MVFTDDLDPQLIIVLRFTDGLNPQVVMENNPQVKISLVTFVGSSITHGPG